MTLLRDLACAVFGHPPPSLRDRSHQYTPSIMVRETVCMRCGQVAIRQYETGDGSLIRETNVGELS